MDLTIVFIIVAVAGIGAQWLAWRWQLPAIVLMLVAGVFVGPMTGLVNPDVQFGDILSPIVALAVALILFEGGLTLDFARLSDAESAVRRLVIFAGPLVWLMCTLTGHYVGGLSWASASVFGGILVVTGPTVVIPLLRQAGLKKRPSEVLKWEAIVNDPVGALAGVLAFEAASIILANHHLSDAIGQLVAGLIIACLAGYIAAQIIISTFNRGLVPEYLKIPVMITLVILAYGLPDQVLHESGLLSVTIMGIIVGNAHLPSLGELRRFKEHVTVILVSGVFILLAARLDFGMLASLSWRTYAFVFAVIFLIRPIAVMLSLIGTNLSMAERFFVGWIGPRGVVAVAVSGLFGVRLQELGVADGAILAPLAFVIVTATVFLHGFSIEPLAAALGLKSSRSRGVLFAGSNPLVLALVEVLHDLERPVIVADRNWFRLSPFRQKNIPVYFGEVLSESAEHSIDHNMFGTLMALTDNDDYNALICADFGPELGRNHVFQFATHKATAEVRKLPDTLGGRYLFNALTYDDALGILAQGGRVRATNLSEEFTLEDYLKKNSGAYPLMAVPEKGPIRVFRNNGELIVNSGEKLIALVPKQEEIVQEAEA